MGSLPNSPDELGESLGGNSSLNSTRRREPTIEFPETLRPGAAGYLRITLPPGHDPIYAILRFDNSRLWISSPNRSLTDNDRFELSPEESQETQHVLTLGKKNPDLLGIEPLEVHFVGRLDQPAFPGRIGTIKLMPEANGKTFLAVVSKSPARLVALGGTLTALVSLLLALLNAVPKLSAAVSMERENLLIAVHLWPNRQAEEIVVDDPSSFKKMFANSSAWISQYVNVGKADSQINKNMILINGTSPGMLRIPGDSALYDYDARFTIWLKTPSAAWILRSLDDNVDYRFWLTEESHCMYFVSEAIRADTKESKRLAKRSLNYDFSDGDGFVVRARVHNFMVSYFLNRQNYKREESDGGTTLDQAGTPSQFEIDLPHWARYGSFGFFARSAGQPFFVETVEIKPEPALSFPELIGTVPQPASVPSRGDAPKVN